MNVATVEKPVTYVSKFARHKFVITGALPVLDPQGRATGILTGEKAAQFENNLFTTADPELIAFLDGICAKHGDVQRAEAAPEFLEMARRGPEIVGTSSTGSVVEKAEQHRCGMCGRVFGSKFALMSHTRACLKKQGGEADEG